MCFQTFNLTLIIYLEQSRSTQFVMPQVVLFSEVESMDVNKLQEIRECISMHACSKCSSSSQKGEENFVKNRKQEKVRKQRLPKENCK